MKKQPLIPLVALLIWILPLTHAIQIGAWVGGPAEEPYPQPTQANVEAFQELQQRKLDYIQSFVLWDMNDWNWTQPYAEVARQNGSVFMITWMANGYPLDSILKGNADAYLRQYASDVKAYGHEIWLRPLHESNGDWYDWGIGKPKTGNTNAKSIAAWKHIVQIFRDSSVTNVKWVWTTNATNHGTGTSIMGAYPGDDWVDYNSIDGYNWGTAQTWSTWKSFEEVFKPAYTLLAKQSKPIFIAEFSSSEHGGSKAQWIQEMFKVLPTQFPKIFALVWFNQSKSTTEADWALDTSPEAIAAWQAGIQASSHATLTPAHKPIPFQTIRFRYDLLGRPQ